MCVARGAGALLSKILPPSKPSWSLSGILIRHLWSWQHLRIEPETSTYMNTEGTDSLRRVGCWQTSINPFDQTNENSRMMLLYCCSRPALLDSFWSMTLVFSIGLWSTIWHFQFNAQLPAPFNIVGSASWRTSSYQGFWIVLLFCRYMHLFSPNNLWHFPLGFGYLALGKGRHLFLAL